MNSGFRSTAEFNNVHVGFHDQFNRLTKLPQPCLRPVACCSDTAAGCIVRAFAVRIPAWLACVMVARVESDMLLDWEKLSRDRLCPATLPVFFLTVQG